MHQLRSSELLARVSLRVLLEDEHDDFVQRHGTTDCLLPTPYYLLLTTHYSLLTIYYLLLTTYYSLLTTYYLLFTTDY